MATIDTPMPTVASNPASESIGRISRHLVVKPPSPRISTSAAKPRSWARAASSNSTQSPTPTPRNRNSSSDGSPTELDSRAAPSAARSTPAPASNMVSRVKAHPLGSLY